ncbi:MAG: hypothetical protein HGB06_02300 [Chlorobaculum sp.]|nr:hypothetical protein [Chlorobaculum sp.]
MALIHDLPVDDLLWPLSRFRRSIQFPQHRFQPDTLFSIMASVPLMNYSFRYSSLFRNIAGRSNKHLDDLNILLRHNSGE